MAYSLARIKIKEQKNIEFGNVETYDVPVGIIPIEVEGYTQIADNTTPGNNQWSYFPQLNQWKILLDNTSDVYIYYVLLLSNSTKVYHTINPIDNIGDKYPWVPKMQNSPSVVQSAKNMLEGILSCLLYTSPSPRDGLLSRMPSSA